MPYAVPFLAALVLSLLTTPLWTAVASRFGIVDTPRSDRWHRRPTAKMGGVPMFVSALTVVVLGRTLGGLDLAIGLGAAMMFAVGAVDDAWRLRPGVKLLLQLAAALAAVLMGVRLSLIGIWPVDVALSVIWIAGIVNAFNLIDNMDGLSAGASVVSSGAFFLLGQFMGDSVLSFFGAIQAGVSLGFLVYNFNPARVFMGDCGSHFLGFIAAALGIVAVNSLPAGAVPALVSVVLILALPVFDTLFVIYQRRRHGRPISVGGKDHTSHRLVALGMTERAAVMMLYALAALSALVGVFAALSGDLPVLAVALLILLYALLTARVSRVNVYGP